MIPSNRMIAAEKRALRRCVESEDIDDLHRRLFQFAEEILRWATEDTKGWPTPYKLADEYAVLIRKALKQ